MLGAVRVHALGGKATVCVKCGGSYFTKDCPACRPPRAKGLDYKETRVQQELVKWLRARPDWMVMRLENALRRSHAQAARDKSLGMLPGAPDLVLLYRREVVFFEVKADDGEMKPSQVPVHEQLRARGQTVLMAKGLAACQETIEAFERSRQ